MIPLLAQVAAGDFDWAVEFRPFTAFHLITAGSCIAAMGVAAWLGTRWRGTPRERHLRLGWVAVVFAIQVLALAFFLRDFDLKNGLPFHICDIAGWIAGFALLLQRRWLRTILYYWGIVLSTQAFATPILRGYGSGYTSLYYWIFWMQHLTIVGSAIYEVIVLRYRPTWTDLRTAVLITSSWVATMFIYNRVFDTNYVFVGPSRPSNPTILDQLGEYPWRVLWLCLIVATGFVIFTAIWPCNFPGRRAPRDAAPSA